MKDRSVGLTVCDHCVAFAFAVFWTVAILAASAAITLAFVLTLFLLLVRG
jgi:hypothetical protein